jgi:type II secretory pathway pseudopilin PulG
MKKLSLPFLLMSILLSTLLPLATAAQDDSARQATSSSMRLFHAFIEDATIVDNQWWEGWAEYSKGNDDDVDMFIIHGMAAFQPWEHFELGATAGFGSSSANDDRQDGSGATDLDIWGKYHFGRGGDATEFAAGGVLTVPTGDDAAGLGYDAFSFSVFGSARHRYERFIISAHAGVRLNGDGQIRGVEHDGELSPMVGVGLFYPHSDEVTFVAEATFESERFNDMDSDLRLLGGVNWHLSNRGIVRGAVAIGLTDGAPDAQLLLGYAVNF